MEDQHTPIEQRHISVMLAQCADLLAPAIEAQPSPTSGGADSRPVVVDATLGMGGHSLALLERFGQVRVIGIDRDRRAIELAQQRLSAHRDRFTAVHTTYDRIDLALEAAGVRTVAGVLFDLGVSSMQLDERERGFAYSYDAPLDMRMDDTAALRAEEIVNTYSHGRLTRILRDWGEEKFASRIASRIVAAREQQPISTTAQLVEIIRDAVPAAAAAKGGHPAKRTFQALRIEVNEELDVLERAVPAAMDAVGLHGRVVAMSYHSLEDRIVKRSFAQRCVSSAPKGFPVELPEHQPTFEMLTRGVRTPDEQEIQDNSRAASARLRAAVRIREGQQG